MIDARHYSYRVEWSGKDDEYVGTVAELPSLSWLDADQGKALEGIRDLVASVIADMEANGEPVPEPFSERQYSGKLMLRITPRLHARLARAAAREHVSLNRLIARKLESA